MVDLVQSVVLALLWWYPPLYHQYIPHKQMSIASLYHIYNVATSIAASYVVCVMYVMINLVVLVVVLVLMLIHHYHYQLHVITVVRLSG